MTVASALAHPEWLWPAVLTLAGVVLVVVLAFRRGERNLRRVIGATPGGADRRLRDALCLLALGAVAIALLGPRIGTRELRVPASGLDVVVLLDLSRSMNATDHAPHRLARALRLCEGVLARLGEGDRAALAVFAGQAALLTPLTPDKSALAEMLPALDPGLMSDTGSLGAPAVEAALPAYEGSGLRPRVLLVVSDGEFGKLPEELIQRAIRAELRVIAVLVGTETGGRIPDHGSDLVDASGDPVVTRRRIAPIAPLVEATGGRTFLTDAWGEVDLPALVSEVRREAVPSSDGMIRRRLPVTWVALPAGVALLALCIEAWPGLWRRRRRATRPAPQTGSLGGARRRSAFLGTLLAVVWPVAAEPQPDPRAELERRLSATPGDARLLIALGLERARAGETDEAERAFRAAALRAERPELAALAWYDLGVLALERGRLEQARQAFFDATTASASDRSLDRQAKFNLEWTLAALRAEQAPPPEAPGDEGEAREEPPSPAREEPEPNADAEPDPADETGRPEPAPQAEPEERPPDGPPPLDEEAARRWLEGVQDDVRQAVEAQLEPGRRVRRGGRRW